MSPLPTAEELRSGQERRFKEQQREVVERRFRNPHADWQLETVWTIYVWDTEASEWMLAGFRRRRRRRKPQTMARFFSKVRRKLGLDKTTQVMVMDLGEAQRHAIMSDQSWRYRAPQFQVRKAKMEQRTPTFDKTKRKSRATVRAYKLTKKSSFIALGRNAWDRVTGYVYLGPINATTSSEAMREAKKRFPIYGEMVTVPIGNLSKPLRSAMIRGRKVSAGSCRVQWPEVQPTFPDVWSKYVKRMKLTVEQEMQLLMSVWVEWLIARRPWCTIGWIRKQVKRFTPKRSRVVWRDRLFRCVSCKGHGKTPSTIQHASELCVPISADEETVCAANAKQIAKRGVDKRNKRSIRRAEKNAAIERTKARHRAAKKAARTRAKRNVQMVITDEKKVWARLSLKPSVRSSKKVSSSRSKLRKSIRPKTSGSSVKSVSVRGSSRSRPSAIVHSSSRSRSSRTIQKTRR